MAGGATGASRRRNSADAIAPSLVISRFEAERKDWQEEMDELENTNKSLSVKHGEVEAQMKKLLSENEDLRAGKTLAALGNSDFGGGISPETEAKNRAEKLKLLAMIDDLRSDLNGEQTKSRNFERRATQAEMSAVKLSAELDMTSKEVEHVQQSTSSKNGIESRITYGPKLVERLGLDTTLGDFDSTALRDQLDQTRRGSEMKQQEVLSLEDQNLKLQQDLNQEKQRVIELKRAAHNRKIAWKEELDKITEELEMKHKLQEENAMFRNESARHRKELGLVTEREATMQREIQQLRQVLQETHHAKEDASQLVSEKAEEMEVLSKVVGGQLVAVERELTEQMRKNSELFELFIFHVHEPLAGIRRACQRIAATGDAGGDAWMKRCPPLFEPRANDLKGSLVKIVELLRFAAEILSAHERRPGQDAEGGWVKTIEDTKESAKRWIGAVLAD